MTIDAADDVWIGAILDVLEVGAFRIDNVAERVVRMNAACARMMGFASPEDAIGRSALEVYEDPKERREIATRFAANEEFRRTGIARLEQRYVRADTREPFVAQLLLKATFDETGRPRFLDGIMTKVGNGVRMEDAFRLGERRFRVLFETTDVPIALTQTDNTISRVNAAFCRFLARPEEALIGASLWSFVHEADRGAQLNERRFPRGTGEIAWGQMTESPISDDAGNLGAVVVVQDVTERKRVEQGLLRVAKLESLGILAGGIAHDFNNVLAVVLGTLSLASRQEDAGDKTRALLAEAEHAAVRARDLARQLITFAKGGTPMKRVASLPPILREAAAFASRAANETVRFDESFPADLWLVDIDPGQMTQVFHNLLLNAVQAMSGGGSVRVHAENVQLGPSTGVPLLAGPFVRVSVTDDGPGIDPAHLDRIFDPYFTTKATGTGLGLATAHSIITRHDGHIAVDSVVGAGTTFVVYLPASEASSRQTSEPPPASTARARVLIMDDDEHVRRMAKRVLEASGFEVAVAADGAAAADEYDRARFGGLPYDAVVLDLVVRGGVGGVEALAKLRAIDPGVRAIVASGYSDDPILADYLRYGFVGAIAKPFTAEDFADAVRRAARSGR